MEKLKKKVNIVIMCLLSFSLIMILMIFVTQDYISTYDEVSRTLRSVNRLQEKMPEKPQEEKSIQIMDHIVYTIVLNNENKIINVINHSQNTISKEKIRQLATQYIKENSRPKNIGCLYTSIYAYEYREKQSLVIMDLTQQKKALLSQLRIMLIIFLLLECLFYFIARILTRWLTRPALESFEKQKDFITDASHELKTPLAVIMASNEALIKKFGYHKYLDNIEKESQRMNYLIHQLLDMATLEKQILQLSEINLSKLVELSSLTYESLMYEQGLSLETSIQKDIYYQCDSEQIKQVMAILIDNAMRHSSPGSTIKIVLKKRKKWIYLEIINYGETISIEDQSKIFDRFYKVDKSRSKEDNHYGLGLAIAKTIIENHHGHIFVQSEHGETKFIIELITS